jgi:hypothetical protein
MFVQTHNVAWLCATAWDKGGTPSDECLRGIIWMKRKVWTIGMVQRDFLSCFIKFRRDCHEGRDTSSTIKVPAAGPFANRSFGCFMG